MVFIIKSKQNDFGGNLNLDVLSEEITNNTNITTTFYGVSNTLDVVSLHFANELSNPELTELDTVISNHNSNIVLPNTDRFLQISKSDLLQTSSTNFILIDSMTLTPTLGTFYVSFTMNCSNGNNSNNSLSFTMCLYKNNVEIGNEKILQVLKGNTTPDFNLNGTFTFNGSDVLKVMCKVNSNNNNLKITNRNLIVIKLD